MDGDHPRVAENCGKGCLGRLSQGRLFTVAMHAKDFSQIAAVLIVNSSFKYCFFVTGDHLFLNFESYDYQLNKYYDWYTEEVG